MKTIIGLAGRMGSGKDTVADLLEQRGFTHVSIGDSIRNLLDEHDRAGGRAAQNLIANEYRDRYGADYFLRRAIQVAVKRSQVDRIVVSGIYCVAEALTLIEGLGGALVAVLTSCDDLRFERVSFRSEGVRDEMSRAEFDEADLRENSGPTDAHPNIARVEALSHAQLVNDGTLADLSAQVDLFLERIFTQARR